MDEMCGCCGKTGGHAAGCVWGEAEAIVEREVQAQSATAIGRAILAFVTIAGRDKGWQAVKIREIWRTDKEDGSVHITIDVVDGADG